MNNKCKSCPSACWEHVYGDNYNLICGKLDKGIDFGITKDESVLTPSWCPDGTLSTNAHPIIGSMVNREMPKLTTPLKPFSRTEEILTTREKWNKIQPQVKWETIEKGKKYHVPPHIDTKRFDFEVLFSCNAYFTFRKPNVASYSIETVYKNDLIYKTMVEIK